MAYVYVIMIEEGVEPEPHIYLDSVYTKREDANKRAAKVNKQWSRLATIEEELLQESYSE